MTYYSVRYVDRQNNRWTRQIKAESPIHAAVKVKRDEDLQVQYIVTSEAV